MIYENAPTAADESASVNRSDAAALLEEASVYSPYAAGATFAPLVTDGFSRVVTLVYEHGSSRGAAMRKVGSPWFAPGSVSDCYYEPYWNPNSPTLPGRYLAFGHEMGYQIWKWLLLLVTLLAVVCCVVLFFRAQPDRYEQVVESETVVHSNVEVHTQLY